jgi:hypothetical protein
MFVCNPNSEWPSKRRNIVLLVYLKLKMRERRNKRGLADHKPSPNSSSEEMASHSCNMQ